MAIWLPGATRAPIPNVSPAGWDTEAQPTWKLLLHTTEGSTYASAHSTYTRNGWAPNLTIGPDPDVPQRVKVWQHLPLDSRSTTLADDAGGIRPNRDYVVQAEIVGFCDPAHKASALYVHAWPAWYAAGVAAALLQVMGLVPIPRRSTVTWLDYPKSYGQTSARLSSAAYDAYSGVLGHMHAPENDHGDPGDLHAFVHDRLLPVPVAAAEAPGGPLEPTTQLSFGKWLQQRWPEDKGLADGRLTVSTALTSGYGHSRAAREDLEALAKVQAVRHDDLMAAVKAAEARGATAAANLAQAVSALTAAVAELTRKDGEST